MGGALMKKIIIIIFFSLICFSAEARNLFISSSGGISAVSCTTSNDSSIFDYTGSGTYTSLIHAGADYGSVYVGIQFTIATNKTITRYKLFTLDGDQSGASTGQIYADSTNTIGSAISSTDISLGNDEIGDSVEAVYDYVLAYPYNLDAGTYWLVFKATGSSSARFTNKTEYTETTAYGWDGYSVTTDALLRSAIYGCDR
jgi:hypothetical protein